MAIFSLRSSLGEERVRIVSGILGGLPSAAWLPAEFRGGSETTWEDALWAGGLANTGFSALNSVTSSWLRSLVNLSVCTYSSHSAIRVLIVRSFRPSLGEALGLTEGLRKSPTLTPPLSTGLATCREVSVDVTTELAGTSGLSPLPPPPLSRSCSPAPWLVQVEAALSCGSSPSKKMIKQVLATDQQSRALQRLPWAREWGEVLCLGGGGAAPVPVPHLYHQHYPPYSNSTLYLFSLLPLFP